MTHACVPGVRAQCVISHSNGMLCVCTTCDTHGTMRTSCTSSLMPSKRPHDTRNRTRRSTVPRFPALRRSFCTVVRHRRSLTVRHTHTPAHICCCSQPMRASPAIAAWHGLASACATRRWGESAAPLRAGTRCAVAAPRALAGVQQPPPHGEGAGAVLLQLSDKPQASARDKLRGLCSTRCFERLICYFSFQFK